MKETILCYKCYATIDLGYLTDDYHEYDQEETFGVVECGACEEKNAVSFSVMVHFDGHKASEEEIEKYFED